MKKEDVKVGGKYKMKVSGRIVPVRVENIREMSGFRGRTQTVYDCTNLATGRACKAHSAQKFRGSVAKEGKQNAEPTPALGAAKTSAAAGATTPSSGENERCIAWLVGRFRSGGLCTCPRCR